MTPPFRPSAPLIPAPAFPHSIRFVLLPILEVPVAPFASQVQGYEQGCSQRIILSHAS